MKTLTNKKMTGIGNSLWPLVKSGYELEIESVSAESYRAGDLILFDGNRVQICHRILKVCTEGSLRWFFVKGDGKLEADGWIPAYRVQGRVTRINGQSVREPVLRLLSLFFTVHSRLQWVLYRALFLSDFGKSGRSLREMFVGDHPIGVAVFRKLTTPWQFSGRTFI